MDISHWLFSSEPQSSSVRLRDGGGPGRLFHQDNQRVFRGRNTRVRVRAGAPLSRLADVAADGIAFLTPSVNMITIRPEETGDAEAVREINLRAFGGRDEAELVDRLRSSCPDRISLVAGNDGRLLGHILFTPVAIEGGDRAMVGMGLAPMAVLPEYQRQGIGSQLVAAGLQSVRVARVPFVVVLGHPQYYPRFGFVRASQYDVTSEFGVPDEMFMILVVDKDVHSLSGVAKYHREFDAWK